MENDEKEYRMMLLYRACSYAMALTDEEKLKLFEYVLEQSPNLRRSLNIKEMRDGKH